MKKAFTLIEMLVVVAILGILVAILLTTFSESTDTARAAKCLVNLKNLAQAANAYGMEKDYYPVAGSAETVGRMDGSGGYYYDEVHGWISWESMGLYNNARTSRNARPAQFNGTDPEKNYYALTNGALWYSLKQIRDVYVCPLHAQKRKEAGLAPPVWSYVMNDYFKSGIKYGAIGTTDGGLPGPADKVLMFAELPVRIEAIGQEDAEDGSDYERDNVLQYQSSGSNKKAESIGFCHKAGNRDYCAHVVFADCHTDKIVYAKGGLKPEKLTELLCLGRDFAVTKDGYVDVSDE